MLYYFIYLCLFNSATLFNSYVQRKYLSFGPLQLFHLAVIDQYAIARGANGFLVAINLTLFFKINYFYFLRDFIISCFEHYWE